MYQEVAIQLATYRADRISDVEQDQQQEDRHEHQPQPQPGCEEDHDREQRRQFVGAGLDEDDRAGSADQPDQRALQREHAGRGRDLRK